MAAIPTIGDMLRAICATDEGLAKTLLQLDISLVEDGREFTHLYCDGQNNCITEEDDIVCTDEMRQACIVKWLRKPAFSSPASAADSKPARNAVSAFSMTPICFSDRCDFCMYREGCLGPLPGDHLGCLAFAVSKEDVPAYESFLADKAAKKDRERALFISSLAEA